MTFEMDDDLSELMDETDDFDDSHFDVPEDEETPDFDIKLGATVDEMPDRLIIDTIDGDVEYIRADAIRAGFTGRIWQAAVQFAKRTPAQPTSALQRARDLIEEGR